MKHLIISLASLLFSLNITAGPGGGGGGVGTVPTMRMHAEVNAIRNSLSNSLRRLDPRDVEALRTLNGDYARLEDLKEGFVNFSGATLRGGQLELRPKATDFEIESVIFIDGSELEFAGPSRVD